jgi:hypothetical protein
MVNKINPFGRLVTPYREHLTYIAAAICRVTQRLEVPLGFRGFNKFSFRVCDQLAEQRNLGLLAKGIRAYERLLQDDIDYLGSLAEKMALRGVKEVVFLFKSEQGSVQLHVSGLFSDHEEMPGISYEPIKLV